MAKTPSGEFNDVVVIIPALNEELPLVLRDLPTVAAVIVVGNGSQDNTAGSLRTVVQSWCRNLIATMAQPVFAECSD